MLHDYAISSITIVDECGDRLSYAFGDIKMSIVISPRGWRCHSNEKPAIIISSNIDA